jgi:hypothetical protein
MQLPSALLQGVILSEESPLPKQGGAKSEADAALRTTPEKV